MKRSRTVAPLLVGAVAVLALLGAPGLFGTVAQDASPVATPGAPLEVALNDPNGAAVGSASFTEESDGIVSVAVAVQGLPPGQHGIHVHAMGVCDPSGASPFETAGEHFNPTGANHGSAPNGSLGNQVSTPEMSAMTPMATAMAEMGHAGDLGNILIREDGTGELLIRTDRITLSEGPTTLFDQDGSTLLIHEMADDLVTDPGGMSGGRIACGVVAEPMMMMTTTPAASPVAGSPAANAPMGVPAQVVGHAFNPEMVPFSESTLEQLQAPEGFELTVFAQNLGNARMMAVGPDGTVYVTRPESNDVLALRDGDGDGQVGAEETTTAATDLKLVHGITIRESRVYLAGEKQVWVADLAADGTLGAPQVLLDNLPDGDQHSRRTVAFGPDGMLYVSIGSSCNACMETNEENAALLRANPDGSGRTIFASGLRNTLGWGWHPETGELWGSDMGTDWLGDDLAPDEFNRIEEGNNFGWPYCFGAQVPDWHIPYQPSGSTIDAYCALTEAPVLEYPAHSSPVGLAYYAGDAFPEEYRDDAFVVFRGSWNRYPATGYKLIRVTFEGGQPSGVEDFVTGWLSPDGMSHYGRIAGVTAAPDGSLLLSDDTNGVIYRVSYSV